MIKLFLVLLIIFLSSVESSGEDENRGFDPDDEFGIATYDIYQYSPSPFRDQTCIYTGYTGTVYTGYETGIAERDEFAKFFFERFGSEPLGDEDLPDSILSSLQKNELSIGNKIGIHDPVNGIFYTSEIDKYYIGHAIVASELVSAFKVIKDLRCMIFVYWKPDNSQLVELANNHDDLTPIHTLRKFNIDSVDISDYLWIIDSLRVDYGREGLSPDSLRFHRSCAGDSFGNINYYLFEHKFTNDSIYANHTVLIREMNGVNSILEIGETRWAHQNGAVPGIWSRPYAPHLYHDHKIYFIGAVDLDFDGVYELLLREIRHHERVFVFYPDDDANPYSKVWHKFYWD